MNAMYRFLIIMSSLICLLLSGCICNKSDRMLSIKELEDRIIFYLDDNDNQNLLVLECVERDWLPPVSRECHRLENFKSVKFRAISVYRVLLSFSDLPKTGDYLISEVHVEEWNPIMNLPSKKKADINSRFRYLLIDENGFKHDQVNVPSYVIALKNKYPLGESFYISDSIMSAFPFGIIANCKENEMTNEKDFLEAYMKVRSKRLRRTKTSK